MSLALEGPSSHALACALAALLLKDTSSEVSAENISSVLKAAGNNVPAYFPTLYAKYIEQAGGLDGMIPKPGCGGGGGGGSAAPAAAAAAPAAAPKAAAPKEEEVDALEGGMDMFGGGGGGGGDY